MELTNEQIEIIAKTIGYHFWNCQTDAEAAFCGSDCTKEIVNALENQQFHEHGEDNPKHPSEREMSRFYRK